MAVGSCHPGFVLFHGKVNGVVSRHRFEDGSSSMTFQSA